MPKGKKAQKKKAEEKAQQLAEENLSPNLLTPLATKSFIMKAKPKLATTAKTLATLTLAVFMALFITNVMFQVMLNRGEKKRDELVEEINRNSYVEETVKGISYATNLFKKTTKTNPIVSEHLKEIVNIMTKNLVINSIDYRRDHNEYVMNLTAAKATSFAKMLVEILNIEQVESIAIDFVEYDTHDNEYSGEFTITIK